MKNNLISAIAGWKSTALLALVAMVAAVAFSGVLTSTQSADAQAAGVSGEPGKTVTVSFSNASDRFRINTDSEGSATFEFNGGQAIRCTDGQAGCDVDADANEVGLRVAIDEDSPIGEIYVQRITRSETGEVGVAQEVVITVTRPNPPAAFKGFGPPSAAALTANPSAASISDNTAGTDIGAQLVNARASGIGGQAVLVTTTRGVLTSADVTAPATCQAVSACNLTTRTAAGADTPDNPNDDVVGGALTVRLRGNGATGEAEVTFRHLASGFTHTATVVLHGPAASISAAIDQGTIAVAGSTFIIVTVSDADGNPVVGAIDVGLKTNKPLAPSAITGPEVPAGSTANLVEASLNVDRDNPGVANDVPACGDHPNEDEASTEDVDESEGSIGADAGTGLAGKCAIQVTAPANGPGPADDATRGTHTLTVGTDIVRIPTVTVDVQVGGAPATIDTSAAPARVDSLSSTSIAITVLDDEGVRVGAVPISVVQVEGSGNTDKPAGGDDAMTSDGKASFTFLAPLTPGEAVFLIRAGGPGKQIQSTITLNIGGEADDDPDAPPATWNNELVAGAQNVVWNGDDEADAADGAAEGVTAIWQWNGTGWDGYFPAAADVPGGNTLDSLTSGEAYWVIVE